MPETLRIFADPNCKQEIIEHLERMFQTTPLEIIATVLFRYSHLDETAKKILGSYNEFIGMLSNDEVRSHIEGLTEESADADPIYQQARG